MHQVLANYQYSSVTMHSDNALLCWWHCGDIGDIFGETSLGRRRKKNKKKKMQQNIKYTSGCRHELSLWAFWDCNTGQKQGGRACPTETTACHTRSAGQSIRSRETSGRAVWAGRQAGRQLPLKPGQNEANKYYIKNLMKLVPLSYQQSLRSTPSAPSRES